MKELKFNEEMQSAIDEGRKTQTRRSVELHADTYGGIEILGDTFVTFDANGNELLHECPYGKVGDINNGCLITDIRVEKLQDISEEDAKKEGVDTKPYYSKESKFCTRDYSRPIGVDGWWSGFCSNNGSQFRTSFRTLWESIYPNHPTKAWELNGPVFVITFEKA